MTYSDLEDELTKEKEEVKALELEKKEWISRGVSAEFEKKDKVNCWEILVSIQKIFEDSAVHGRNTETRSIKPVGVRRRGCPPTPVYFLAIPTMIDQIYI